MFFRNFRLILDILESDMWCISCLFLLEQNYFREILFKKRRWKENFWKKKKMKDRSLFFIVNVVLCRNQYNSILPNLIFKGREKNWVEVEEFLFPPYFCTLANMHFANSILIYHKITKSYLRKFINSMSFFFS